MWVDLKGCELELSKVEKKIGQVRLQINQDEKRIEGSGKKDEIGQTYKRRSRTNDLKDLSRDQEKSKVMVRE